MVITASIVIATFNALDTQAIEFAVLDINVGGENSFNQTLKKA